MSVTTRNSRANKQGDALIALFRDAVAALSNDEDREAARILDQVLRHVPTNPDARCLRGIAASRLGEFALAIRHLRIGTKGLGAITTDTCDMFNEFALALRSNDELDEAEAVLRSILTTNPLFGPAWHNLALLLQSRESIDEAVAAARKGVATRPGEPGALLLLGKLLRAQGRLLSARAVLQQARDYAPDDVSVCTTLGNTYFYLGEIDAALTAFRHTTLLHPNEATFHSNYATMLTHCRRYDEARVEHDTAFALAPTNPDVVVRRAAFLLNTDELTNGWKAYDARIAANPKARRWTGTPEWQGNASPDATLLVYREQGLGDELMFASIYPELAAMAGKLIIECDPRVERLFARSFPFADVRVQSAAGTFDPERPNINALHPEATAAIPAGSTLQYMRPTLATFPDRHHFLEADAAAVELWRQRLVEQAGTGPLVGISWRSMVRTAERRLEYTRLDEWGPILSQATTGGLQFVLLQYDQCEREVTDAERRFGIRIHRWHDLDLMNDLESVAALTINLDAVIAPRNAVAMLSGALGTDTLALGNAGDWAECGTTQLPWFTTVECINRSVDGDWSPVIAEAASRIQRLQLSPTLEPTPGLAARSSVLNDATQRKATV